MLAQADGAKAATKPPRSAPDIGAIELGDVEEISPGTVAAGRAKRGAGAAPVADEEAGDVPAAEQPRRPASAATPRINAFWNASLNDGAGGWDWVKIREAWVDRGMREGRMVSLSLFATETGVTVRSLLVRARHERWKSKFEYRLTNEKAALPVEDGEDYHTRLLRIKRDAVLMAERLAEKVRPIAYAPKVNVGKAKQAVMLLKEIVEMTREEARAPENRSRKEIAFKGLLVPAAYAAPGMNGDFILAQMPGAAPKPAPRAAPKPRPRGATAEPAPAAGARAGAKKAKA